MPTFDFRCKRCEIYYEELVAYDATGKYKDVKCPECGSKSKEKLVSAPNFKFANPVGTDRWNSSSTGHDYRFKHNVPNVQKERQMAEQLSHMGANPYGNAGNDIEKYDTGVHDADSRKGLS